ncbi:hypothetical protein VB620_14200 [Nodularia harveyana UHCC-0300]|uniref:Uncharacterized protein n=1 Tax=Nodularia harveyana UHCC-0300 TaxID=2974287 RepID=A0ABU5UG27_9CYAN|nr:hypothetical protein [Nodularia harveyana]MEA5582488.1 hypothetical protein [Nodularia harveyana UHCC-0300]
MTQLKSGFLVERFEVLLIWTTEAVIREKSDFQRTALGDKFMDDGGLRYSDPP